MTTDTEAEVAEQRSREQVLMAYGEQMMAFTESLELSGLSFGDVLLSLDTAGFQRIGSAYSNQRDMLPYERVATVLRSRLYWQREPTASRPVSLWTDFAFGSLWSFTAKDSAFQPIIDSVINAKHNRKVFGRQGAQRNSNSLLVDGERWFAFFVGDQAVRVRNFDPLEITDVLTNPEDKDEPWYYVRRWTGLDRQVHVWVYRDWEFVEQKTDGTPDYTKPRNDPHPLLVDGSPIIQGVAANDVDLRPQEGVWLTYLAINTLGERGYPLATASLDWIREHREFMRDRASLNKATAQYAMKAVVKGGAGDVNRLKTGIEGSNTELGGPLHLRGPRAATFVQNEAVDLSPMPGRSDGSSAEQDGSAIRQMALAATGIPEHIWGDVSKGNLATASALERPLEIMFGSYQGIWIDFRQDMFEHLAGWRGFTGDITVDIDTPTIFERWKITEFALGLGAALAAFPVLSQSPELLATTLNQLGLNNVEDVVSALEPMLADQQPTAPPDPGGTPGQPPGTAAQAELQQAIEALREARRARAA